RLFRERALGCLVISIGNLTVGGTGKTPIVEKFARALQAGGRRIAILSRGYKSVPRKRNWFSWLRGDFDPPRVVSDGKSLLRDSPRNLRRASYIFITKNTGEPNFELMRRIRRYNRTAEVIECAHKPLHLENVFTGERLPLDALHDAFIGSLCAIAAPESFEKA